MNRVPRLNVVLWIVAALLIIAVVLVYAPRLIGAAAEVTPVAGAASLTLAPSRTPTPTGTPVPSLVAGNPQVLVSAPAPSSGAKFMSFASDASRTGYSSIGQERLNWGDRNLHVGIVKGKLFQSALFFDLTSLPPGTKILFADVELTGLSRDFIGPEGEWRLDLLKPDALARWSDLSPLDLQNAQPEARIGAPIKANNLLADHLNQFVFAPDQLPLLESAVTDSGLVAFRLSGPTGPADSLFTWDSGAGVPTRAPVLRLVAVPAEFVIVPNPPTPQNILTVAAQRATATAFATRFGTPTPYPRSYATATPVIFVTAQPTPANQATADAQSAYATAVALTTGTFTPTPSNWVVITPPPPTSTPLPTWTPLPSATPTAIPLQNLTPVVTPTPGPSLGQLLQTPVPAAWKGSILFYSNRFAPRSLLAMSPAGDLLANQPSGSAPYNLALAREALSPDHTRRVLVVPDVNGILQIWISDLNNNIQSQVTHVAKSGGFTPQAYDPVWSPDGSRIAYVSTETRSAEIFVYDLGTQTARQLTATGDSFIYNQRPSWSPDSSQIAFKSNREGGHFQIWIMNADGSNPQNVSRDAYDDTDPVWVK